MTRCSDYQVEYLSADQMYSILSIAQLMVASSHTLTRPIHLRFERSESEQADGLTNPNHIQALGCSSRVFLQPYDNTNDVPCAPHQMDLHDIQSPHGLFHLNLNRKPQSCPEFLRSPPMFAPIEFNKTPHSSNPLNCLVWI